MTDRKTISERDDDTRTLSSIEQISTDSSPTESGLHQLDVVPSEGNASYSLGRLEQDLRTLHSKWRAVEQEIAERDAQIAALGEELERSQNAQEAIEADLEAAMSGKSQLAADLQGQQRDFEKELERQSQASGETHERVQELEAENTGLRVHLQELQAYIDGRKDDWAGLKDRLRDYENTITGLSARLESHDKVVAQKEDDKAAIALKAMELERDLAEAKGRNAEKEKGFVELQQVADDQARELGSLNAKIINSQKDIEKLETKLQNREASVQSLKRDLKDRSRDSTSLEELLSDEKATIQKQQSRIAELEGSLRNKESAEEMLQGKLTESEQRLEELDAKAAEFEIRAAELQAMLLESQSEQKSLDQELEAQRELVQVLEIEVANKQENLDLLDRSAERISAIRSGIREIDFQIDDHWVQQPTQVSGESEEVFEKPDEVMLDPNALFDDEADGAEHIIVTEDQKSGEETRIPLLGREVTIGRSRRSNIRLRSKYISRIHARIKVEGEHAIIEDAGSTNGFLVNSVETKLHELTHGDTLEIGDCKLRYLHAALAS